MSDIREKPEQIIIPTDPINGPATVVPTKKRGADKEPPLGRTTDRPYENEG
ncbi:hypothetical protein [Asticcacaulis solisilvae]|uniref:hypothetical protein n=1 Tax=Asticcacaulis solisilvae TaxID=1217274 RepID=UPI003FD7327C